MANAHVSVTMPPEMVEQLDGYRATQQPIPTRAEVVRQAVEALLAQLSPRARAALHGTTAADDEGNDDEDGDDDAA